MFIKQLLWAALLASTGALAQTPTWFTVTGDPEDPAVNTIQVDPVDTDHDLRTLRVRVSRSTPRTSWDGVPYRSYNANVLFECAKNRARYLTISYFKEPRWVGEPFKTVDYTTGPQRMMEFRDVAPNPTQRILHAACQMEARR